MRLVTWNCKGAFHRKHAAIASLAPDILIVPECGRLTAVTNVLGAAPVRSCEWVGDNEHKGLGVVSYGDYAMSVHPDHDPALRWILPLQVEGPRSFLLLAVWTVPDPSDGIYIHALFRALARYERLLESQPTIIAGDFNQSVRFDKPGNALNFAEWMVAAERLGLRSVYHDHRSAIHNEEGEATFYLHHSAAKPYHIDFVFASPSLMLDVSEVRVGTHAQWAKLSDHMPVSCAFGALAGDGRQSVS